jgi:N-acyl-phosphatidylethanolamine-hydrolysing phospholipase D
MICSMANTFHLVWLLAGLTCGAVWASERPETPARPAHHTESGFRNNYIDFAPKGVAELVRWRWQAVRNGLPKAPQQPTPVVKPDLAFIAANAVAGPAMQPAATWVGHATVLLQVGGINILTDPIFSNRASPVSFVGPQRAQPPGLGVAELPHIHAVLVSHNHYDHCDLPSLLALNAQAGGPPLFLFPLGMKEWAAAEGIQNVVELDWWQGHTLQGVEIVLAPVQHWSGRGLTDRLAALWGGYAVFAPDFHAFFAGDTGYSRDFADIRQRFAPRQGGRGFDLALIPVGAYEPRWFMANQHVNPAEAVRIHVDLQARRSLGIHWGTFELTDEALDEPPRALATARAAQAISEDAFFLLAIGQTRKLQRRSEGQ